LPWSKAQESCHKISNKCNTWHGYVEDPTAKHSLRGRSALSPWSKARGSCHKISNNQPYSGVWISLGDSIPGLYCVAWLTQESVSWRIFVKKKGMNPVQSNGRSQQTPSAKRRKRENSTVVMLLPGSHERLASRNPCVLFQKHGGACTMY
jgi:hypothetical protein